mgnify:FL=1
MSGVRGITLDGRFGRAELALARQLLAKAEALAARHAKPLEDPPLTEKRAKVLPHAQEYIDAGLRYNPKAISEETSLTLSQVRSLLAKMTMDGLLPHRSRNLPRTERGLQPLDYANPLFTKNKGLTRRPLRAQLAATPGVDVEALRAAAIDALAKAARDFDPARGHAFSTLAVMAIARKLNQIASKELKKLHGSMDAATDGVSLHDVLPARADTANAALTNVEAEEAAARLLEVSHKISKKNGGRYAMAFLLHRCHGLKQEKIAEALGFNNRQRVHQVVAVIEKRLAQRKVSATSIPPAPRASRLPSRGSSRKG